MTWSRFARRARVPLGFVLAALFLWLSRPTLAWLLGSVALVAPGLALRAAAAGHVKKNRELTRTGPYAYTRNPLYLGSMMIGVGFAVASRSWWIVAATALMFFAIYLPVIRSEEEFLRGQFPEFPEYVAEVPRLFPRLRSTRGARGTFSTELYNRHREYNALIGSVALYAALILKIALQSR